MHDRCDYCKRPAIGGCFGFHACAEHLDRAAKDGHSAYAAERAYNDEAYGPSNTDRDELAQATAPARALDDVFGRP